MGLVYIAIGLVVLVIIGWVFRSATDEEIPKDISDAQIAEVARAGKKILAIKWYRQLHSVGLKEAKDAVEGMVK